MIAEELAKRMWTDAQGTYADDLLPYARALIDAREFMDELELRDHPILGHDDYQAAQAWHLKATLEAVLGGARDTL